MADSQPPEGLRSTIFHAIHESVDGITMRQAATIRDAVLAALFEACEVREEWGAELLTPGYPSGAVWYPSREGAEKVRARHEPLPPATMGGLLRRLVLAMPGEVPNGAG